MAPQVLCSWDESSLGQFSYEYSLYQCEHALFRITCTLIFTACTKENMMTSISIQQVVWTQMDGTRLHFRCHRLTVQWWPARQNEFFPPCSEPLRSGIIYGRISHCQRYGQQSGQYVADLPSPDGTRIMTQTSLVGSFERKWKCSSAQGIARVTMPYSFLVSYVVQYICSIMYKINIILHTKDFQLGCELSLQLCITCCKIINLNTKHIAASG